MSRSARTLLAEMDNCVTPLLDLPEEIISITMSFADSKSLRRISLCSISLQRITLPYLYQHITLYVKDYDPKNFYKRTYRHLRHLTSLFLRKPYYAPLVRHLTIRKEDKVQIHSSPCVEMEVEEVIKEAIKASSHSEQEEKNWLRHVSFSNDEDALLAIMLPTLVRLKKLDIITMEGMEYFERTMERVGRNRKPFDTQPTLIGLTDVVHHGWSSWDISSSYLGLFLLLPAIQTLKADRLDAPDWEKGGGKVAKLMSRFSNLTLTHLELKDSCVPTDTLRCILRVTKNLKSFIYEVSSVRLGTYYSFLGLQEALENVEICLENLWLQRSNAENCEEIFFYETDMVEPMSFFSFMSLKSLHVEGAFLYSDMAVGGSAGNQQRLLRGIFPHQLETLEIVRSNYNNANLVAGLKDLLEERHLGAEIVNLKELIVLPSYSTLKEFLEDFSDAIVPVYTVVQNAGVAMTVERRGSVVVCIRNCLHQRKIPDGREGTGGEIEGSKDLMRILVAKFSEKDTSIVLAMKKCSAPKSNIHM